MQRSLVEAIADMLTVGGKVIYHCPRIFTCLRLNIILYLVTVFINWYILYSLDVQVFLQSDIEAVAVRMKNEFTEYGKGKLVVLSHSQDLATDKSGWLMENPFGVSSDWEKHVLDRGASMYRILLTKAES